MFIRIVQGFKNPEAPVSLAHQKQRGITFFPVRWAYRYTCQTDSIIAAANWNQSSLLLLRNEFAVRSGNQITNYYVRLVFRKNQGQKNGKKPRLYPTLGPVPFRLRSRTGDPERWKKITFFQDFLDNFNAFDWYTTLCDWWTGFSFT